MAPASAMWALLGLLLCGGVVTQAQEYPRVETILGQEGDDATALYSYSDFWAVVLTGPVQNDMFFTRDNDYTIRKLDFDAKEVSYVSGEPGNNGDNVGSFGQAKYDLPRYMTYAPDQNALFVADTQNIKIKKLDLTTQEVTLAAGDGDSGYVDTDAEKAAFANSNSEGGPQGLAYLDGVLYAADSGNSAIRKLENGTVSTLASLSFNPWHVAVDPMNKTMFIAEREGHQIYSLDMKSCSSENCNVSVIAGRSGTSDIIDGQGRTESGEPGDAAFNKIKALAYDPSSTMLYAGEYKVIRAINTGISTYNVTTVAGDKTTAGYQDGPDSRVQNIHDMVVDSFGTLIFSDRGNARIRRVLFQHTLPPPPSIDYPRAVTVLGQEGDDALAIYSHNDFWGLAEVPKQNATFFTRDAYYTIFKFDWVSQTVSYVSGESGNNGDAVGSFGEAKYDLPRYMTYAPDQNALFVADTQNIKIKKLDLTTQEVTVVAGDGDTGYENGDALKGSFADSNSEGGPQGLAYLDGAVYAADSSNGAIRKLEDGVLSTLISLSFNPWHVAVDPMNKTMFVAEREGTQIYSVDVAACNSGSCTASLIAGRSDSSSITDGQGLTETGEPGNATFRKIMSLAYDPNTYRLFAGEERAIRAVATNSSTYDVETVAGDADTTGYRDGSDSRVDGVVGMTVRDGGDLVFSDRGNARIRQVLFAVSTELGNYYHPPPPSPFPPTTVSAQVSPPPPSPSPAPQGEDRPTASQRVSLSFNDTSTAARFAQEVEEPVRLSRQEVTSRRSLQSSHPSAEDIAYETLASAIRASESAEDGVVVVAADRSEATMDVTLYYPEDATEEIINDDVSNNVATRSLQFSNSEWQAVMDEYGVATSLSEFESEVNAEGSFNVSSGDGAGSIKAPGLFVTLAAVLSAALLA